ncbi:filamentous hemagglutinin N-terminal domain-containing protein [Salmonella enterica]|nr:filamentous hemagglutinin N-terminal domain-containing protein [Salmonella enterica]EIL0922070.1 filamentous hemagglutinin N-terminal domain-containing protein [Salmonella enterica]EIL6787649.1 filamentous hemagglutinin N-terminal domain-containing protein [Salmonella enterica]ELK5749062.1 filamentous hemagglutinin N-terminal domain-containing protein [Salmonella enterica]ELN2383648.1 filamentous hemagglutinin N-terminal domain-containing protein [Salmonella enterica]
MNRIYKLKFDKRRNELVVVSEITAGMGKEKSTGHIADLPALSPFRKLLGTLTPVSLLTGLISGLLPAMVLAADLPTGGQIVGGQGSISTSGNQMTIHQQTQNMATNWHSFDIGKNNTVQFVQPDSSSVALNRVTGASGSQIMGTLKANGQVFILNPNGVLFGKNARVDVGGLVASTKNISTADFMKGQYTLSGEGNPGAQVINQGSLTTSKGGYIVLAGERVSNSGTVTTPGGKTVLAAGKTVTLQLDNGGLTSVSVNGSVVNALVENRGLISASNGQVYLTAKGQDMLLNTVVNNSGTVEAKGLVSRAGEIVLDGGDSGVVSQSGQLLADSQTGQGGKITLEGQNIHLAGGSLTSATGKTGGGEVYVGGGWQGKDSRIRNASKVVMDKTATVDVSATEAGNGGTAVLWSDDYTNFRGTVLAKGGSQSGNGGRVETSSHRNLQASGTVDASSPSGKGGEWLLDPTDVTIVGSGADSNIDSTTNAGIFTPTASGAQILNTSIVSQLNAGTNVTVKTSGTDTGGQTGNITVNADIVKTAGADTKLTLLADNNIATAGNVSIGATTGKLNLDLLAGNITDNASVVLGRNINISLNGGDFYAGPGNTTNNISLQYSNNGKIAAGNITMNVTRGLTGYAASAIADNDLTINGTVSMTTGWGVNSQLAAGGVLSVNSPGAISLTAVDRANGGAKVTIKGDEGVNLNSGTGINLSAATTNNVSISSDKGDITLKASNGSVLISGADASAKANITSGGNITITGNGGRALGVGVINASVNATNNISITGSTTGGGSVTSDRFGGIYLAGNVDFHSPNGSLTGTEANRVSPISGGVVLGNGVNSGQTTNILFDGNFNIRGTSDVTNTPGNIKFGGGIYYAGNTTTTFSGGNSVIQATGSNYSTAVNGDYSLYSSIIPQNITLAEGANLSMKLNSGFVSTVMPVITADFNNRSVGWVFSGKGNVSIDASNSGTGVDSSTLQLNLLNNKDLDGSFTVNAVNARGNAILMSGYTNVNLVNATITGTSRGNGAGIQISSTRGTVNLNNVTLNGNSVQGNGISVSGNGNTSITDSVLNGKSTSGRGSGVVLTAGSNYTLDGGRIIGGSVNGYGVLITGALKENNGTSLTGTATGSGNGVRVEGNLTTVHGDGIQINGVAASGNGVMVTGATVLTNAVVTGNASTGTGLNVSGNATLTNATLSGETQTGSGAVVTGKLTVDGTTQVTGKATQEGGTGVTLNGTVTGGKVDGTATRGDAVRVTDGGVLTNTVVTGNASTGTGTGLNVSGNATLTNATLNGSADSGVGVNIAGNLTTDSATQVNGLASGGTGVNLGASLTGASVKGTSDTGAGVQLADHAVVTGAILNGSSTSGNGMAVTGNVTLDDTSATALKASSTSGTGLRLADNANVSIQTITSVTQAKKDADGNPVLDADGNAVMETITTQAPVITPVTLTGTSAQGTGVATEGNVSVSGVVLNGSTTADTGTGVSLGGNLTIADNISGVTAGATGNGTALVVNNASIHSDGYTGSGKDFVINAAVSGSGTAIKIQGSSQLDEVVLNGTATGGGTAVELGGKVTGANITGTSDSGTAVQITDGGALTNAMVTGNATTGTGLNVSGNATLTNATVSGETQTGTGAVVNGKLTADDTTQVTGKATQEGGTGVTLNGTVTGGKVDGTATSGDAVRVTDGGVLTNAVVTGNASTGTGLNVSGNATLTNATVSGTTETGTGAVVTGKLTITDGVSGVTAKATGNGTGLLMENATLQANGYVGPDKAHAIVATAEGAGGTAIKIQGDNHLGYVPITGNAFSVGGTGVSLGGQVSFANIKGVADRGTAVAVADGTVLDGGAVHGRSDNGTGLAADGNVTLNGALISGSVQGSGTGVSLKGNITGGTVTGISVSSGDAVQIVDSRLTDTEVKGDSQTGAGVKTQGNVTLQGTELSATSEHGITDLDVSGALNRDQYSVISADRIAGQENIHVLQPDTPPSPEEGGATGGGGNTTPDTGDSGGVAGGDTGSGESGGTVTPPSGGTGGDAGNNGNTGSTAGSEGSIPDNNAAQPGGAPGPAIREQILVSALRQQAVDAQVTRMNQATPDGFHSAATPVVPVTGYQAKPQNVEINLCDEESCQPEALDAAMPAEGVVTSSGK